MDAGKPIFCIYPWRRGLRIAAYATNVTIDASVSVSRRRPDQHNRGDELDGGSHADRRSDIDGTHAQNLKYPAIAMGNRLHAFAGRLAESGIGPPPESRSDPKNY